jgi:hypothetical protein
MFIAPPGSDKVRPNLMITLRPLEAGVDLQTVARLAREQQEKEYAQYQVVQESMVEKEPPGFSRTYRWYQENRQAAVVQQQILFIAKDVLYTITATRPEMDQAAEMDALFEHMIQTFKFD